MSDEVLQFSFRQLIVKVSDGLSAKNCQTLNYLYRLRIPKEDMQGLGILIELEERDYINYKEPDKLEQILTEQSRQDLVKLVTEYKNELVKSQSTKKSGRKGSKLRLGIVDDAAPKCQVSSNIVPATLMTLLNINSHTFKLFEESLKELSPVTKEHEAAVDDIKSRHKQYNEALKKCIKTFQEQEHILQTQPEG